MPRAIFLICVCCSCIVVAGCEPLTSDELKHEVGSIHSTAAEGALLAEGVAQQRTSSPFVRAHAAELAAAAETSARKLHDATVPTELRSGARRAIALARRTSSILGDLSLSPSDPGGASRMETRLKRLAAGATRLEARV
jgi:hypothetical protein